MNIYFIFIIVFRPDWKQNVSGGYIKGLLQTGV